MSIVIASSNFIFLVFLGLQQVSILCPLFILIYINNILSNHVVSTVKQLALDVLFFIAHNAETSADEQLI